MGIPIYEYRWRMPTRCGAWLTRPRDVYRAADRLGLGHIDEEGRFYGGAFLTIDQRQVGEQPPQERPWPVDLALRRSRRRSL